jgi:NTE family protein
MIALALSGGGSRAMAFHLGCMRALHDRGVVDKVKVISAVSGGAVIAGLYAYKDQSFESFDKSLIELLQSGRQRSSLRHLLSPELLLPVIATNIIARPIAAIARLRRKEPRFRRWTSRINALVESFKDLLGQVELTQVARQRLK